MFVARRPRPGRQEIPAGAARGLRVRRDHLDAFLGQIAPIPDAFRVTLADQKDDRRGVGSAVVLKTGFPINRDLAGGLRNRDDVRFKRERHHIGVQAVDHQARLLSGAAMRCLDRHRLARIRLPFFGKGGVEFLVEFPGRVIGHVQDRRVRLSETDITELQHSDQKSSFHDFGKSIGSHINLLA
ncbi:hypothetical protein ACVMB3_004773 [Sinorhizobium meliloti]